MISFPEKVFQVAKVKQATQAAEAGQCRGFTELLLPAQGAISCHFLNGCASPAWKDKFNDQRSQFKIDYCWKINGCKSRYWKTL